MEISPFEILAELKRELADDYRPMNNTQTVSRHLEFELQWILLLKSLLNAMLRLECR